MVGGAHVSDTGGGPALVMAHGMELDHTLFEPQQSELSNDFRTVAYDLRARTALGEQPYDLYDLVSDFERLLDDHGIDRCVFVGMSMGGFTAIRAAFELADRISGVVLIGSCAVPYSPEAVADWRPAYEALREARYVPPDQARSDAELHFAMRTQRRRPDLVDTWAKRIETRSGLATWQEFRAWAEQDDLRPRLAELTTPVLIIHGDEDQAVPIEMALETHALISTSRLMVLPFAAHAANLEWPAPVNAIIRAFATEVVGEPE
jgi:pimeloyl-ACP methyl ester carboxylesterase